jgi:hypothetical protein
MFLASRGYWGGNPESILKAPADLVVGAFDFALRREQDRANLISDIAESVTRGLR